MFSVVLHTYARFRANQSKIGGQAWTAQQYICYLLIVHVGPKFKFAKGNVAFQMWHSDGKDAKRAMAAESYRPRLMADRCSFTGQMGRQHAQLAAVGPKKRCEACFCGSDPRGSKTSITCTEEISCEDVSRRPVHGIGRTSSVL